MEKFTQLFWEMFILGLLALVYFYYQKSKILKATQWSHDDWHMLYHLSLEGEGYENFEDFADFLEALEKIINTHEYPQVLWFDKWRNAKLPTVIIETFPEKKMTKTNYITPMGYQALVTEFDQLLRLERPKITELVTWAASNGDRSENADYQYGKKRLREIDRRLRFFRTKNRSRSNS